LESEQKEQIAAQEVKVAAVKEDQVLTPDTLYPTPEKSIPANPCGHFGTKYLGQGRGCQGGPGDTTGATQKAEPEPETRNPKPKTPCLYPFNEDLVGPYTPGGKHGLLNC
jgi:hypothetical protein